MKTSPLDSAIVRILHQETQEPLGTGFLVSPSHIFTCAHVVADALDIPKDFSEVPKKLISLDFPFLPNHYILKAKIRHWYPIKDEPSVGDTEDFVILEVTGVIPYDARPIVVRILENFTDHSVQMRGFPKGKDDGVHVNGRLQGLIATGRIEIQTDLGRGRVAGGFSGAAVWDKEVQAVVGMIVSISRYDGDTLAYMIPAETLLKAWPELNDYQRQRTPYQALKAFSEQEAEFFFGREHTIEEISKTLQSQSFVALIGASGSGKTSLIQAGLIPHLQETGQWFIVYFRPQKQPFKELMHSLSSFIFPEVNGREKIKQSNALIKEIVEGDLTLSDVARIIFENPLFASKKRLLLIVDQFEELYNLNPLKELQQAFIDCLLEPLQSLSPARKLGDQDYKITLLLSMRADFFGEAIAYNPFAKLLDIYPKKILGTMDAEDLRVVIEAPAAKFGVTLETGLTNRILRELGDDPGNLPLLEFMLTQLWGRQQLQCLTHAAYESIGGVTKALAEYADSIYEKFSKADQEKLQRILVQLIAPGRNIDDTKQTATREQIGEENWDMVIDLADSRLVVTGYREEEKLETAEIAHETLIQHWHPLREWINRDREFRLWQERLRFTMNQWKANGQDRESLLRGETLSEAEKWLRDRENDIPQKERAFIKLGSKNKKRSQLRWKIGVSAFTTLAITVAFVFWGLWKNAEHQQLKAEIRNIESRNQSIRSQFLLKNTELETLLSAVKTAIQSRKINLPTTLKNQVKYNLLRTVYGTHEKIVS